MEKPGVLILTRDAGEYPPLLDTLAREGADFTTACDAEQALSSWSGQPVILGEPDLVAAVLDRMPGVRWVQSSWAGVTPLLELDRRDYVLTGIKEVFGQQMAEYTLGYLLAHELRMFERLRRQAKRDWWQETSGSLQGRTLGIMGTGSIGRHVARRAAGFGMRLLGFSRSGAAQPEFERVFSGDELPEFLVGLNYLVCVLPDTPQTDRLLNAAALSALPDHCFVVNIGRGNTVDEAALVEALTEGMLGGAVLDVFREEPLPADSPLWDAPNLLVTAHVAADSRPRDIARVFGENYRRYVAGEALNYRVDFDRGY